MKGKLFYWTVENKLYRDSNESEGRFEAVGELEMYDCKITVIKRSVNRDIIENHLKDEYQEIKPCDRFKDGQEFVIAKENRYRPPEGVL